MEISPEHDALIYNEMMSHVPLFSHPNPQKIAILHSDNTGIKQEVQNHPSVTQVLQLTDTTKLPPESLDVLIIGNNPTPSLFAHYFGILQPSGILLQQNVSPLDLSDLKLIQKQLHEAGFRDTQPLLFPQSKFHSGWRSATMAIKQGVFRRIREKDIFNKSFATHYYNLDMHKAALALPEFMRKELAT